jgi:hypothetical protein
VLLGVGDVDHPRHGTVPWVSAYEPFSSDGHVVRWSTWDDSGVETTTLRWENEGWTVSGIVSLERIEYVLRISASWQLRQFLLFRDLPEPDLWLATDGSARWGEMNGAHRTELDGCYDIDLACTPFTSTLPIRRLQLHVGDAAELPVVCVDPELLEVRAETHRYTRLESHRWRFERVHTTDPVEFEVDQHGLVVDFPGSFRRVPD